MKISERVWTNVWIGLFILCFFLPCFLGCASGPRSIGPVPLTFASTAAATVVRPPQFEAERKLALLVLGMERTVAEQAMASAPAVDCLADEPRFVIGLRGGGTRVVDCGGDGADWRVLSAAPEAFRRLEDRLARAEGQGPVETSIRQAARALTLERAARSRLGLP